MKADAPVVVPATPLVLVSGLSGAGKSTALKILEDLGYEAVDNIPLSLLPKLTLGADGVAPLPPGRAIAVGVDSRTRDFNPQTFVAQLDDLARRPGIALQLVFFDCDDDVLQNRFSSTRRRHPMARDRRVMDGVEYERKLMAPVRDRADRTIDTSRLALPELRQLIAAEFGLDAEPALHVLVTSFGYGRGLPREADLVFDVRFLANPHYDDRLREKTGDDAEVGRYIAADPKFAPFFRALSDMLLGLLPHYLNEGKRHLTVAIGCTGGRHRSVFVANELTKLMAAKGFPVAVRHRDKDRGTD
jgi:UPF0042 nucleotide-binding protein